MNYECIYNINCKYSAYKFYINDYIHLNNYTQQLQYYKINNTKNHMHTQETNIQYVTYTYICEHTHTLKKNWENEHERKWNKPYITNYSEHKGRNYEL